MSIIADKIIHYRIFTRKHTRIIMQILACMSGIFLILCGYTDNITLVIAFLVTGASLMGCVSSSFNSSYIEVSPTLANIMHGISNTLATISGVISPILTGFILGDNPGSLQWQIVFYIAAIIFLIGTIPYIIFVKAKMVHIIFVKAKMVRELNFI